MLTKHIKIELLTIHDITQTQVWKKERKLKKLSLFTNLEL